MDLHKMSATEVVEQLQSRDLSSTELISACLQRSAELERDVHGYAVAYFEDALVQARAADKRLAQRTPLSVLDGMPITVKENIATYGHPLTMGLLGRREQKADHDAVVVRHLRASGMVILGKSNVPQTLLSFETDNAVWGRTNNPWRLDRTPGGSSGGESALIASGQSMWGLGSDVGGSIRIPAAFTGICGLKPTLHRWSNLGSHSIVSGQEVVRAQVGPLARTTKDLALLMTTLTPAWQSQYDPSVPPWAIPAMVEVGLKKVRVGFYTSNGLIEPAASVQRAVREAAQSLEPWVHSVKEIKPVNVEELTALFFGALSSDGGQAVDRALGSEPLIKPLRNLRVIARLPAPARLTLSRYLEFVGERRMSQLLQNFGRKSVARLWELTARRTALRIAELEAWDRWGIDVLLCPPHVTPALPHGMSEEFNLSACYCVHYSTVNFPAGVVPVTRVRPGETQRALCVDRIDRRAAQIETGSEGLPLGVQVVARPYREEVVLAAMQAIESERRADSSFPCTPVDPQSRGL